MQRGFGGLALTIAVALGFLALPGAAVALDFTVMRPIAYDNMLVYPIQGDNATTFGNSSLLTVEQAEQQGLIRIHHNSDGSVSADNLSTQGVFVPFGTLLAGGRQDQVVGTSQFLPPSAQNVPLVVFCVDPFRSTARQHENAEVFSTAGDLIPSQTARLSMVLSSVDSKSVVRLRQSGVWWSIDTLRSSLEKRLGVALEPPEQTSWMRNLDSENRATTILSQRSPNWTSSLPLALSNRRLIGVQAAYMKPFAQADDKTIGAVFAVNGQVIEAEVYRSPELFQQMWPHLLRAYTTIAISQKVQQDFRPPSIEEVNEFLSNAPSRPAESWAINDLTHIRNTESSLYLEDRDLYGDWIQRTYLSKVLSKRQFPTPDELVVHNLDAKYVNGWRIDALSEHENVEFIRGPSGGWVSVVVTRPGSLMEGRPEDAFQTQAALAQLPWHFIPALTFFVFVVIFVLAFTRLDTLMKLGASARPTARAWSRKCIAASGVIVNRPLIPDPLAIIVRPCKRLAYGTLWLADRELRQKHSPRL